MKHGELPSDEALIQLDLKQTIIIVGTVIIIITITFIISNMGHSTQASWMVYWERQA